MSLDGTASHDQVEDLPPLVRKALDAARLQGFTNSCLLSQGRLLQVLAGGIGEGVIGETGTGCGVGTAWMASGARPGVRLVSVEADGERAEAAKAVFAGAPQVTVVHGDWRELREFGPFEMLVLDGGGQGKGDVQPIDPRQWLQLGGLVVIDDFTPTAIWPPVHDGHPDHARLHWLHHPDLAATQVRTQPDSVTVIGTLINE